MTRVITPMTRVIIQGAGITGAALAFWLRQNGCAVTMIERSPSLRIGGQAVDIRGAALAVIERMGLTEHVRALRTRIEGMSVFDGQGGEIERTTERTLGNRIDSEDVELFRDDLSRILHGSLAQDVKYVFGDEIVSADQDADGVNITLASGVRYRADILVGADGLHSGLRRLLFGPHETFVRHLGYYAGIYSAPNRLGLKDWQLVHRSPERGVIIYPTRDNRQLRVAVYFACDNPDPAPGDEAAQRALFKQHCEGLGGPFPMALAELDNADDLYASALAQVHMDRWTHGRVALTGDAAFCPSPLTGQGTSLGLVGAYVLAQELARSADVGGSLTRYEQRMRGFVEINQGIDLSTGEGIDVAKNAIDLQM